MPITPEGRVKKQVRDLFAQFDYIYAHWPVQNGMGKPCLDCHASHMGRYFAVETKAPGKKMTPRQENTAAEIRASGARVFVIDGEISMIKLRDWLSDPV